MLATSFRADQAVKMRQQLENMNSANEEQCDKLETQLKEDKVNITLLFLLNALSLF